jgi:hypothetical protein
MTFIRALPIATVSPIWVSVYLILRFSHALESQP